MSTDQVNDVNEDTNDVGKESNDVSKGSGGSKKGGVSPRISIPRTLSADDYLSLSADDRVLFEKDEGGKYKFMAENAGELRRAKERISAKEKEQREELRELKERMLQLEDSRGGGQQDAEALAREKREKAEIERLEQMYKSKLSKKDEELNAKLKEIADREAAYVGYRRTREVDRVANEIANELAISPYLMLPHIKSRLGYELVEGKDHVFVADSSGQRTHETIDDLKKSLKEDKRFAAAIKAYDGDEGLSMQDMLVPKNPAVGGEVSLGSSSAKLDLANLNINDPSQMTSFAKFIEKKTAVNKRKQRIG